MTDEPTYDPLIDARVYYRTDRRYLRSLIDATGLPDAEVAARLGIGDRTLRAYLTRDPSKHQREAPYAVQVALEALAARR